MLDDHHAPFMLRAIELAKAGQGRVEPNPMVGCVLVRDGEVVGAGCHAQYGQAHAEVNAIRSAGERAKGSTAYVTLEPCSHTGKTPPCANALIEAGVSKVFVAVTDPNPKVSGAGIQQLTDAGIEVHIGLLADEATVGLAPYLKRVTTGLPWVIAKYAMTLDGRIATASGDSKWISNEASRALVHRLRGRVDAIAVGRGTVELDDPLLTARPAGVRVPRRVVFDSQLAIDCTSQLALTAADVPVDVFCDVDVDQKAEQALSNCGVHVRKIAGDANQRLVDGLKMLVSDHGATNVLVEGGGGLLGSLRDLDLIDEIQVFIGARLIGGEKSRSPVLGTGVDLIADSTVFQIVSTSLIDGDIFVRAMRARV